MADTPHSISVTLDPMFSRALEVQRGIQTRHMGGDPAEMDPETKRAFVRDMSLAMMVEAVEALDEAQWKPWAKLDPTKPLINREMMRSELADVFIFLMNLMLVADISVREFMQAVYDKQQINIERQLRGYTGGNKCPVCGRAYDDPAVKCVPEVKSTDTIVGYSAVCAA